MILDRLKRNYGIFIWRFKYKFHVWKCNTFNLWKLEPYSASYAGDMFDIDEWIDYCMFGGFIDYDGYGVPTNIEGLLYKDFYAKPSLYKWLPKEATHIIWYNR